MGKQETIKSLIPNLPEKDAKLAIKFLENQELEALKLLIDSAIYKIKKTRIKTVALKHRFEDPTVDNLEQLKIEVDDYFYSTEGITAEEYAAGSDFTYETIDESYYHDEL